MAYITDPSLLNRLNAVISSASTAVAPLTKGLPTGVAAAVNSAQVLSTTPAAANIGSLSPASVTGLLAQVKSSIGQASNVISVDKGIGQFGLQPTQLEAAGFLKPGTLSVLQNQPIPTPTAADIAESARIISEGGDASPEQVARNRAINTALGSPMSWTGKGGVSDLGSLLNNSGLQNIAQQGLMNQSLQGLISSGLATGKESAAALSGLVQSATKFGVGAVDSFVKGLASPDIAGAVGATIKGAKFATDFVQQKLGDFNDITARAQAAVDTVDRTQLDAGVKKLIGDAKIPAPEFRPAERQPEDPALLAIKDEAVALVEEVLTFLNSVKALADEAIEESVRLDAQQPLTEQQIASFEALRDRYRTLYNNNFKSTYKPKIESLKTSRFDPVREYADYAYATLIRLVQLLLGISESQRKLIQVWRDNAVINT